MKEEIIEEEIEPEFYFPEEKQEEEIKNKAKEIRLKNNITEKEITKIIQKQYNYYSIKQIKLIIN